MKKRTLFFFSALFFISALFLSIKTDKSIEISKASALDGPWVCINDGSCVMEGTTYSIKGHTKPGPIVIGRPTN